MHRPATRPFQTLSKQMVLCSLAVTKAETGNPATYSQRLFPSAAKQSALVNLAVLDVALAAELALQFLDFDRSAAA